MLTAIASSAYRVVMALTSFVLTNALSLTPIIGPFLSFMFLSWVNAYVVIFVRPTITHIFGIRYYFFEWAPQIKCSPDTDC